MLFISFLFWGEAEPVFIIISFLFWGEAEPLLMMMMTYKKNDVLILMIDIIIWCSFLLLGEAEPVCIFDDDDD